MKPIIYIYALALDMGDSKSSSSHPMTRPVSKAFPPRVVGNVLVLLGTVRLRELHPFKEVPCIQQDFNMCIDNILKNDIPYAEPSSDCCIPKVRAENSRIDEVLPVWWHHKSKRL